MRFLAGAEDEILHAGLIRVDLLEVMHILAVLLLDEIQNLIILIFPLFVLLIPLQLESSSLLQILVFEGDTPGAALPYNTYLSRT